MTNTLLNGIHSGVYGAIKITITRADLCLFLGDVDKVKSASREDWLRCVQAAIKEKGVLVRRRDIISSFRLNRKLGLKTLDEPAKRFKQFFVRIDRNGRSYTDTSSSTHSVFYAVPDPMGKLPTLNKLMLVDDVNAVYGEPTDYAEKYKQKHENIRTVTYTISSAVSSAPIRWINDNSN